jgi:phage terminase Nu1 subunit (DNA packaging protein)
MFTANKFQQLKYTELFHRHVSTIDSNHRQGIPVRKETHREDGYYQYAKHVR